jgi:alkanesulfonate monooxygenase SsuD/methylene tetrahydromethanopterin reductase-like flavin-dependent oxidoreductase (luciferase family)
LGVGISWNPREYQALAQDFSTRGRRFEEQIALLRRMWTEPYVDFTGDFHRVDGMGVGEGQIPPPIPILLGAGMSDRLLQRTARIGDGWIPLGDPVEPLQRLKGYLEAEGRDPASFPVPGRLMAGQGEEKDWVAHVRRLREAGINEMEIFPGRGVSGSNAAKLLLRAQKVLNEEFG